MVEPTGSLHSKFSANPRFASHKVQPPNIPFPEYYTNIIPKTKIKKLGKKMIEERES